MKSKTNFLKVKVNIRAIVTVSMISTLLTFPLSQTGSIYKNSANAAEFKSAAIKSAATKIKPANFSDVESLTFKSTAVTMGGKKKALASDKAISISFKNKSISANAGCNTMNGSATLVKGVLKVKALASTRMACTPALMKQDTWLNKILTSNPKLTIQGKNLTISSGNSASSRTVIKMAIYETYGYADTPLGDENSEALVKETCSKLIADKATESQAQFAAEQNGLIFRVTSREGEDFAVTMDYRVNRMNVKILGGVVVECTQG